LAGPLPIGEPVPADGSLPASVLENSANKTFHAYVHVPFCRVRCGYCDFNTYTSAELPGYGPGDFVGNLRAELAFSQRVLENVGLANRELSTVFFGGGTPTQLESSQLTGALASLRDAFGIKADAEITTEANPDNVDHAYLAALAAAGFTRVSFGMQSAIPEVLKTLERTHKPENVPFAVGAAKQAGLGTSVDLIYGAPGETMAQWQQTVDSALELETDHISAYALIVEPGTKLARQIRSGVLTEPDDDLTADKYEYLDAALSAAGFEWYELSNFSKSAQTRSAHNMAYWNTQDWWGYGPGAHSHVGGVRWWNQKHPTGYAAALAEGVTPAAGRELLSDTTRLEERLLLELRLRSGLAIEVVKAINPKATGVVATLIADGLVEASAALVGSLVLTLKGRLLADAVVRRLI
jgi:oxygen-independent coproporphyrinogen-3 oxidase